ncbi:MAG: substrate-binding domain-containing protein [Oxalobacter sp.]
MYKVSIEPHWRISHDRKQPMDTAMLLKLLDAIQNAGTILQAAKEMKLSYRHAWGLLREAEAIFGTPLLEKNRGRGTTLTRFASTLLWAQKRISARLSAILESLSSELEIELAKSVYTYLQSLRLCASHGFAVSVLMENIIRQELSVNLRYQNSMESLASLAQGDCEIAGFHLPVMIEDENTLQPFLRYLSNDSHLLIHLANLEQGLLIAQGNPKRILSFRDLTKDNVRFVNRQSGSSTRQLFESMLAKNGIDSSKINGFETTEFTHAAVAAYIASNMADVGFGVETAARRFGLDFVPLVKERYFFAIPKDMLQNPTMREILAIMNSRQFSLEINQLGGYDATDTGHIYSVDDIIRVTPKKQKQPFYPI